MVSTIHSFIIIAFTASTGCDHRCSLICKLGTERPREGVGVQLWRASDVQGRRSEHLANLEGGSRGLESAGNAAIGGARLTSPTLSRFVSLSQSWGWISVALSSSAMTGE
eukprot:scaffold240176_cov39-Tisochrysis_lutea.AAC.3